MFLRSPHPQTCFFGNLPRGGHLGGSTGAILLPRLEALFIGLDIFILNRELGPILFWLKSFALRSQARRGR